MDGDPVLKYFFITVEGEDDSTRVISQQSVGVVVGGDAWLFKTFELSYLRSSSSFAGSRTVACDFTS